MASHNLAHHMSGLTLSSKEEESPGKVCSDALLRRELSVLSRVSRAPSMQAKAEKGPLRVPLKEKDVKAVDARNRYATSSGPGQCRS